jgi:hypothetical protein
MKKTLKLVKNIENYELKENDKTLILIENKKIKGEDIYDKIYKDIPSNVKSSITINADELKEESGDFKNKEDKLMYEQLKTLFKKIDEAISSTIKISE